MSCIGPKSGVSGDLSGGIKIKSEKGRNIENNKTENSHKELKLDNTKQGDNLDFLS